MKKIKHNFDLNIGYLSNLGKFSWKNYKERSEIARNKGVGLLYIPTTIETLQAISNEETVNSRYWNGRNMVEIQTPIPEIFYDKTEISRKNQTLENIYSTLERKNASFINFPNTIEIISDKWKTYQIFEKEMVQMPKTHLYSTESLEYMLELYSKLYVKKRVSSQGKNHIIINKLNNSNYNIFNSNNNLSIKIDSLGKLNKYLKEEELNENWIIQQGIETKNVNNRMLDLRAIFQRGKHGNVSMTCLYGRVANNSNSLQTNISKKGHPQDLDFILENEQQIEKDISVIGNKIVSKFSKIKPVGEIGIDFIIDNNLNLYFIEANAKPGNKGIRTLAEWNPKDIYYDDLNPIPFDYSNSIREVWGNKLRKFLENPIQYGKFLEKSK